MSDPTIVSPGPVRYQGGRKQPVRLKKRFWLGWLFRLAVLLAVLGTVAFMAMLLHLGRAPREWAPELRRRALGHAPVFGFVADIGGKWLIHADRLVVERPVPLPASLGASADRSGDSPDGRLRLVSSQQELAAAIATARPGDVIQIQPGRYRFVGGAIHINQPGTASALITLRAARLGDVVIESDLVETLKVEAPYWRFENLSMRGVCGDHTSCEHAFHIVGGARSVVVRNNILTDYNAHIKINGEGGLWPDDGMAEGNTLTDTMPRVTANPITPIDLVGASNWVFRGNIITDFVRADGMGGATYGGFVKGEGEGNVFERNLVVCEWKIRNVAGQHVGLSLGGGGTGMTVRRLQGRTGFEQVGGVIRDNLIAFCSDDGIYVNRAARSVIDHNTLLDTAGIDVRFIESSATVTANIVDGVIRTRNGGTLHGSDNIAPFLLGLFAGWHPQRGYYRDPATLDLTWLAAPDALPDIEPRTDLCGHRRGDNARPGAFDQYADCLQ
jgi:hypothetical protein